MDENNLEVLLPEITLNLQGREVTVREYSFVQGMRVDALAKSIYDGLERLFLSGDPLRDSDKAELILDELQSVWGADPELMTRLLAMSTGEPEAWIDSLPDLAGQTLLMSWWTVNRHFFVRRLAKRMAARRARERLTGERSSPA